MRAIAAWLGRTTCESTVHQASVGVSIAGARGVEALVGGLLVVVLPLTIASRGGAVSNETTATQVGLLISSFGVALFVGQWLWRRLPSAWARPTVVAVGFVGSGLAILSMAAVHSLGLLIVLRCIQGLCVGMATPPLLAWIARLDPSRAGRRLGGQNSLRMIGFTVGPLLGGVLLGPVSGPRLLALAGLAVVGAGVVFLRLALKHVEAETEGSTSTAPSVAGRAVDSVPIPLLVGAFAATGASTSLLVLQPVFREQYGLTTTEIGAALSAMLVTRGLLDWRVGIWVDRRGADKWAGYGLLVLALGSAIVGVSGSVVPLLIGRVIQGAGMTLFTIPSLRGVVASISVRGASTFGSALSTGLVIGPLVTGGIAGSLSTLAAWIWIPPLVIAGRQLSRT